MSIDKRYSYLRNTVLNMSKLFFLYVILGKILKANILSWVFKNVSSNLKEILKNNIIYIIY